MVSPSILEQVTFEDLLPKVRLDKDIVLYQRATPVQMPLDKVRVFRASRMHKLCPVESAYVIKLIEKKAEKKVLEWFRRDQLKAELTPIVDTGTVIHKQLQYYAGLTRKVRAGQWKCPFCGFFTHKGVPMPAIEILDSITDLEHEYPAPCPKCKGSNLGVFPPWLYVEPTLQEKARGVPNQYLITGHTDGLWSVRVRVGKKMFWINVVVDFKTINLNGFEERYGGGLPKEDHVPQMQTYLNLADEEFGLLIYYSKNDSKEKFRFVQRDHKYWQDVLRKVTWARKGNLKRKEEFRVCPNIGHPRSRTCFFQETCWGKKAPENFLA